VSREFGLGCTALPTEEFHMLAEYTGVLVILAVAAPTAVGILVFHWLAGPRRRFDAKDEPFDCGGPAVSPEVRAAQRHEESVSSPRSAAQRHEESVSSPRSAAQRHEESVSSPGSRQAVKFHLVAILFVVFVVEAVFFYLWAVVFSEAGAAGLVAITVFSLPLVVGLVYEWAKGALEW
jgi:NADH-quinone oxidoreductase subunit A